MALCRLVFAHHNLSVNVFRIHSFSEKNDVVQGDVKVAVKNAILAYILYSMQSGTAEKIISVVRTHFAIDDIITAKDML